MALVADGLVADGACVPVVTDGSVAFVAEGPVVWAWLAGTVGVAINPLVALLACELCPVVVDNALGGTGVAKPVAFVTARLVGAVDVVPVIDVVVVVVYTAALVLAEEDDSCCVVTVDAEVSGG